MTPRGAVGGGRGAALARLLLFVAPLSLVAAGCGGDSPEGYSDEVRDAFMTGCVEDNDNPDLVEVCQCTYDTAVKDLPFEQFEAAESRLQDGSPEVSDEVIEIILGCIREVSSSR